MKVACKMFSEGLQSLVKVHASLRKGLAKVERRFKKFSEDLVQV